MSNERKFEAKNATSNTKSNNGGGGDAPGYQQVNNNGSSSCYGYGQQPAVSCGYGGDHQSGYGGYGQAKYYGQQGVATTAATSTGYSGYSQPAIASGDKSSTTMPANQGYSGHGGYDGYTYQPVTQQGSAATGCPCC